MKKRFLALVVVCSILLFSFPGVAVPVCAVTLVQPVEELQPEDSLTEELSVTNQLGKFRFYLDVMDYEIIDSMSELNEAIEYVLQKAQEKTHTRNVTATASSDEVRVTVWFEGNVQNDEGYRSIRAEQGAQKNAEEVRAFRSRLNGYTKAYHEQLVAENLPSISALGYTDITHIGYTPCVVIKIPADQLNTEDLCALVANENVACVCLSEELVVSDDEIVPRSDSMRTATWAEALKIIGADDVVGSGQITGDGMRIGVLESAICDATLFPNVIIDPACSNGSVNEHTNKVVSIISAMATGADIFASMPNVVGIQWFLDENCDIVNCSFGYTYISDDGYRMDVDGIYDYQIEAALVTVVKSAGNVIYDDVTGNAECRITSPGYAFNVITVGGVRRESLGWVHNYTSSYMNTDYSQTKPNISAPSKYEFPGFGEIEGTSYSAPLVTGCIALLLDDNDTYSTHPDLIYSLIHSTAQETVDYYATVGAFDDRVGAGMINLEEMLAYSNSYYRFNNTRYGTGTVFYTNDFYVYSGDEIEVALSWFVDTSVPAGSSVSEVYLTEYNIYLINTVVNVVMASSTITDSNVELIRYTPELSGTYCIEVRQVTTKNYNNASDMLSLTYHST